MSKNTNRSTKQTIWMTIERFVRQMLGCCRSRVCSEGHMLQLRIMLIIGIIFFVPSPPTPHTPHRHKREVPENLETEVKYILPGSIRLIYSFLLYVKIAVTSQEMSKAV